MVSEIRGLNNVIKATFANPNIQLDLNITQTPAQIQQVWSDALEYSDYKNSVYFQLGADHSVNIAVAVKNDSNGNLWGQIVPGEAATNSFDFDRTFDEQKLQFTQFERDTQDLLDLVRANGFDASKSQNIETLEHQVRALASGMPLAEVSSVYTPDGPKYIKYIAAGGAMAVILSPSLALAATNVLGHVDGKGTLLVDGVSLALLGFGLKESGVIPSNAGIDDVISILKNSNIASAIGAISIILLWTPDRNWH